jgi:hypothetical protein
LEWENVYQKHNNMAKKKVKEEVVVVEKVEVQPIKKQDTDGNTSRDYRSWASSKS